MAYIINTFNTAQLTVVEDGTIDQTTDLKLVGKNYAGYGEIQNENFVYLLENFAGANQPPRAIAGQVWYDSANSKLKFYDGTQWRTTGGAEISSNAPAGLSEGDFWWDTANEQLYAYNGVNFILVGPQGVGDTITRFQSRVVRDDVGVNRPIIVSIVGDEIIHAISNQQFTIGPEDSANYLGFDIIRKGITLKNTTSAQGGVTVGDSNNGFRFWGTATNADKLGGFTSDSFVRADNPSFGGSITTSDAGIIIGNTNDVVLKIINDNKGLISNLQGDQIFFQVSTAVGSGIQTMPLRMTPNGLFPGYSTAAQVGAVVINETGVATVDIGSSSAKFGSVYATNLNGLATSASALRVAGEDRGGSTSATANTVTVRDSTGDIYAAIFHGLATSARYADLAEKYLADSNYAPGTVVMFGGEAEVTECKGHCQQKVAGVISSNPGFILNQELSETDGFYPVELALKGRVPCNVIGKVKKGDLLVSSNTPGVAVVYDGDNLNSVFVIGKSLENSEVEDIKLVEIAV